MCGCHWVLTYSDIIGTSPTVAFECEVKPIASESTKQNVLLTVKSQLVRIH